MCGMTCPRCPLRLPLTLRPFPATSRASARLGFQSRGAYFLRSYLVRSQLVRVCIALIALPFQISAAQQCDRYPRRYPSCTPETAYHLAGRSRMHVLNDAVSRMDTAPCGGLARLGP